MFHESVCVCDVRLRTVTGGLSFFLLQSTGENVYFFDSVPRQFPEVSRA